jgi:methylated-DNA-[protein]-cysteine S-methyltransferase
MAAITKSASFTAFATRLGWMAMIVEDHRLKQLVFGYPTKKAAIAALTPRWLTGAKPMDSSSALVSRLQAYSEGEADDFSDISVDLDDKTPFQRKVLSLCRKIPLGRTATYGEIAAKAGSPGAARAVGSCMAANRIPLVIPCHRVVAAGVRLGNYSAPGGTETKRRLLEMERNASRRRPLAVP